MEMRRRLVPDYGQSLQKVSSKTKLVRYEVQCKVTGDKSTHDQHQNLDHVSITDHFHTSQCNNDRKNAQSNHAPFKADARDGIDGERAEINDRSEVYENIGEQPEDRHERCYSIIIALC